jgi:protein-L-isoaspartate O-methyltransferase
MMDVQVPDARVVAPPSDPTILFEMVESMQAVNALIVSVAWLDLYEWLAQHPGAGQPQICEALELSPRPAHVLLTLLVSFGLIDRLVGGGYVLTKLARDNMLRSSPWSLAPCYEALKETPTCKAMLAVLRTGSTLGAPMQAEAGEDAASWQVGMNDEGFAEHFLNAIDSRNAYLAHAVAERAVLGDGDRLLDVGGGSGIYACALARCNPTMRATVLEKAPVDAIARRAIERRGLTERVSVLSSDMLSGQLPGGYDVHLYSNVVHDWDETIVSRLLRASFEALPVGGQIILHDAFLGEVGTGPRAVAEYSVLLMAFTAGRCYSVAEIRALLDNTGFVDVACRPTAVHRSLITAVKPHSAGRSGNGSSRSSNRSRA